MDEKIEYRRYTSDDRMNVYFNLKKLSKPSYDDTRLEYKFPKLLQPLGLPELHALLKESKAPDQFLDL